MSESQETQAATSGRCMFLTMRALEVDERDSSWEMSDARYRLFVFDGPGNAVTTIELLDARRGIRLFPD